jgi:hypothetical protein
MGLEDLVLKAQIIVIGKVVGLRSTSTDNGPKILAILAVSDTLKGSAGDTIVVTQPGGAVGGLEMRVSEAATFSVGEEVALFLWTRPNGERALLGLSQGKLPVHLSEEGAKFILLPPEEGQKPGEKMRLEDFVRRVAQILDQQSKTRADSAQMK